MDNSTRNVLVAAATGAVGLPVLLGASGIGIVGGGIALGLSVLDTVIIGGAAGAVAAKAAEKKAQPTKKLAPAKTTAVRPTVDLGDVSSTGSVISEVRF